MEQIAVNLKNILGSLVDNPKLVAKVNQGQSVSLNVKTILPALSEGEQQILARLPEELILFRFVLIDGVVQGITLKLYVDDEDDAVKIFGADEPSEPIILEKVQYLDYTTGINGFQKVGFEKTSDVLIIPLSLSPEYDKQLKESNYDPKLIESNKGLVPSRFLKYRPRPTRKVADLEIGATYSVNKILGVSKMYGSARYELQQINGDSPVGEPFEIYSNKSLNNLIVGLNLPVKIKVISKQNNPKGEGVIVSFALANLANLSF
jgi:hypothetical protein